MSGSPAKRGQTTADRPPAPNSRSRQDSRWQLASPASSVGDWYAGRRSSVNRGSQREDAGNTGGATAVPGLAGVEDLRVPPTGVPAADGERMEVAGARSSSFVAALPAPDSPASFHGSDDEDFKSEDMQTGGGGGGRLRGEDRLEALAAVLAAAEAGSGDGVMLSQCLENPPFQLQDPVIDAAPSGQHCCRLWVQSAGSQVCVHAENVCTGDEEAWSPHDASVYCCLQADPSRSTQRCCTARGHRPACPARCRALPAPLPRAVHGGARVSARSQVAEPRCVCRGRPRGFFP